MSKLLQFSLMIFVITLFVWTGCEKAPPAEEPAGEEAVAPTVPGAAMAAAVELCTDCGQIKGSDACCKPDAEKCPKCEMAKGSPGCCKIPEGAESVSLCTKCGCIAGSDECCAADAEKCPKCGLAAGSPGCCKLPKAPVE